MEGFDLILGVRGREKTTESTVGYGRGLGFEEVGGLSEMVDDRCV